MERAVGRSPEGKSRDQRAHEIAGLLQQAQLLCQEAGSEARDDSSRQLFLKIAALLDDVVAVLAHDEQKPLPRRTVH